MNFGVLLPAMLLGLLGLAIPILIHLLNRRRYQVVDWGAMRFLKVSEATRRRLLIEEILLMALRMGLIAALVLALAAPYAESPAFAKLRRANRDVVLIFDGSASMGFTGGGKSAHEAAREWAKELVADLSAGDNVAVHVARARPTALLAPTHDLEKVRQEIDRLPTPSGGADLPTAVAGAIELLTRSGRPERDVVVLTDGQRFGYADEAALRGWGAVGERHKAAGTTAPRVWVVPVDANRPATPRNWSLAPLRASRAVASVHQEVRFRTALELRGQESYAPPHRLRLEVDGLPVSELPAPGAARFEKGQVPLTFTHRFKTPGSHLVTVVMEPDPPPEARPAGYAIKDQLPADNRVDLAVDVLEALPILIVDGDTRPDARRRGSDFLRKALAPDRDPTPAVVARVVRPTEFTPATLTEEGGKEHGGRPRVVVLANVARLEAAQRDAVATFVREGGGLLVALGERVEAAAYNEEWYREGEGLLPARLEEPTGDESRPADAARPVPSSFDHPALDLFREAGLGGLGDARFPRWWKVTVPRGRAGVPVAMLNKNDPLLVERTFGEGRVLLSVVPLDNSWRTNVTDLPAFAPLAHELVYYLAGARGRDYNVAAGQPLRYALRLGENAEGLTLQPPTSPSRPLVFDRAGEANGYRAEREVTARGPFVVYAETTEPGPYRVATATGRATYFTAQPDARESDLAPATEADREAAAGAAPLRVVENREQLSREVAEAGERQEVWWWLLLGVVGLLCSEVWFTRRMALAGAPAKA